MGADVVVAGNVGAVVGIVVVGVGPAVVGLGLEIVDVVAGMTFTSLLLLLFFGISLVERWEIVIGDMIRQRGDSLR